MSWLSALPHQIPFRAASGLRRIDEKTVEGIWYGSSADALTEGRFPTPLMIVEAMAQIAGALAFGEHGEPAMLSAIDEAVFSGTIVENDALTLRVTLDAGFGGIFRFSGIASRAEAEVVRARFYLAAAARES